MARVTQSLKHLGVQWTVANDLQKRLFAYLISELNGFCNMLGRQRGSTISDKWKQIESD